MLRLSRVVLVIEFKTRVAVASVLRCIVGAGTAPLDEAIALERAEVMRCFDTEDQREGMRAFMEKRRPVFTGK